MALKLGIVVSPVFQEVIQKILSSELPSTTAFKFKSIIKEIHEAVKKHDEVRAEILNRYCVKGEDGKLKVEENGAVTFEEGKRDAAVKELEDLVNLEVSVGHLDHKELGDKVVLKTTEAFLLDGLVD